MRKKSKEDEQNLEEWNSARCHSEAKFQLVQISYAPINVKPAGGRRGIGRDFDIFQKIAVKFPTPGQKCEVKCNWNSPPKEVICGDGHE